MKLFASQKKAIARLKPGSSSTGRVAFNKSIVPVESCTGGVGYAP